MLSPRKTDGPTLSTARIRRKQKRKKRRLVEGVESDWQRWDAAAAALGVNWSSFARMAMNSLYDKVEHRTLGGLPGNKTFGPVAP